MKILHVISQRPEMTGSGVYINHMIAQALRSGHSNALLAGIPANDSLCAVDHSACCAASFVRFGDDLPHLVTGMSDVMPYPSTRFRDFDDEQLDAYEACFADKLQHAIDTFEPDVVHCNHLWLVTSLAKRLYPSLPVVASCHGSDLRQFQTNEHLRERVLSGCSQLDGVFALHRLQKNDIIRLYGIGEQRITVTGAGVDTGVFCSGGGKTDTVVRIAYAGKIASAKGVPWLLDAFAKVHEAFAMQGVRVELELCGGGTGDEYTSIVQRAESLGDSVTLHGNVSQQRLAEILCYSHVFVLPSLFEGLPLVLLEALACGCRVVATELPGVLDVFAGSQSNAVELVELPKLENVDIIPEAEQGKFTNSLAVALSDSITHSVRGEQIAQEHVEALLQRYSWQAVFTRIEDVYTRVVKNTSKRI